MVKGEESFDFKKEAALFTSYTNVLAEKFGAEAFVKHKGGRALGGLAPAYFDAVSAGLVGLRHRLKKVNPQSARTILNEAIGHENDNFRDNVGPGANSVPRLHKRIETVKATFDERLPN